MKRIKAKVAALTAIPLEPSVARHVMITAASILYHSGRIEHLAPEWLAAHLTGHSRPPSPPPPQPNDQYIG